MKNGGGFARRTTVVSFIHNMENYYRWKTTVVGFKLRTLVGGELQVEKYSCWLQMKKGGGFQRRKTVVSFRWRTTALGYRRKTAVVSFK